MTPLGTPIDRRLFFVPEGTIPMDIIPTSTQSTTTSTSRRRGQSRNQGSNGNIDDSVGHNIDAGMLQQDFALVSVDTVLRGRVSASKGLGMLMSRWPNEVRKSYFLSILMFFDCLYFI
jgi:TATA-binding protein-associated factor